ncbi:adenylosuccinate lyase [Apiospora saccharicola]
MASQYDKYETPIPGRYASPELSRLFSARNRHSTWRKLWLQLAKSQKELGIDTITPEALEEMEVHLKVTDGDYEVARVEEKRRRHDVMGHIHAFGAVAPAAAGQIHYGATSCFVTDNTELILMRDALDMLTKKLAKAISNLSSFKSTAEPTLGRTHLKEAQLVTVGKRAAHWAQDLMLDLHSIDQVLRELKFRGAQGTTGTQASFPEIFQGDSAKCDKLNELLCKSFGFPACYGLSSQTYARNVDLIIANAVTGIGTSAQKIAGDIRLLAAFEEIDEPFEEFQIGSSAMPYKCNPASMRCERICAHAVLLTSKQTILAITHANQRLERTLNDSAARRTTIPEMMLLADAICRGLDNVTSGLVVYPRLIAAHIQPKLPFMITEPILMKLCAHGVSRQEAHEQVRVLSNKATYVMKIEGKPNDLISRFKGSDFFKPIWADLDDMLKPELYIGRSVELVDAYCGPGGPVEQALAPYMAYIESSSTAEFDV